MDIPSKMNWGIVMKNETLINASREILLDLLLQLEDKHRAFFIKMYFHKNQDISIEDAVENLPVERIDWAISQAESTLRKMSHASI